MKKSAIVFMNSKFATEKLAKRLNVAGISANAIHGDLRQNKRERVISGLRNNKFRVLVATDVAARGIDIPHIYQVINFDPTKAN
jgi:superfamily II DNA/RNA helicase